MIPIYRAKKIDSDEYIEGCYSSYKVSSIAYEPNHSRESFRSYNEGNYINDGDDEIEIDPSTLAIHFPEWKCLDPETGEDTKAFASLQKNRAGGDQIEIRDNFAGANGVLYFTGTKLMIDDIMLSEELIRAFEVTGIYKGETNDTI